MSLPLFWHRRFERKKSDPSVSLLKQLFLKIIILHQKGRCRSDPESDPIRNPIRNPILVLLTASILKNSLTDWKPSKQSATSAKGQKQQERKNLKSKKVGLYFCACPNKKNVKTWMLLQRIKEWFYHVSFWLITGRKMTKNAFFFKNLHVWMG